MRSKLVDKIFFIFLIVKLVVILKGFGIMFKIIVIIEFFNIYFLFYSILIKIVVVLVVGEIFL